MQLGPLNMVAKLEGHIHNLCQIQGSEHFIDSFLQT